MRKREWGEILNCVGMPCERSRDIERERERERERKEGVERVLKCVEHGCMHDHLCDLIGRFLTIFGNKLFRRSTLNIWSLYGLF